ncbi:MAG: TadE/TadG family type IV pilus assembly protein [Nocardioides sp.]|uniref:TadE/TadG family type IV pilus assembly protein n=1 Tax=Nocardioides sp. TaxID=35761 RepID=UPI0039E45029
MAPTVRARRTARATRGAAAVEFAFVVPILLLLVFGLICYGYMFSFRQNLSQAASEGARAAVGAYSSSTCATLATSGCVVTTSVQTAVASSLSTYRLSCGSGYLTCTISLVSTAASGCPSGHTCVKVDVSYPYRAHPLIPTVPGLGVTMPSNLSFTSVVQVA